MAGDADGVVELLAHLEGRVIPIANDAGVIQVDARGIDHFGLGGQDLLRAAGDQPGGDNTRN